MRTASHPAAQLYFIQWHYMLNCGDRDSRALCVWDEGKHAWLVRYQMRTHASRMCCGSSILRRSCHICNSREMLTAYATPSISISIRQMKITGEPTNWSCCSEISLLTSMARNKTAVIPKNIQLFDKCCAHHEILLAIIFIVRLCGCEAPTCHLIPRGCRL